MHRRPNAAVIMKVSTKRVPDSPTTTQPITAWEQFHGLSAPPFSLTHDLRFIYHSRSHTRVLEQVTSALRRREGLIVLTGEIGAGKTMLCRMLLDTFNEARTFLSVILDPGLSASDLLYQVLIDFGLVAAARQKRREALSDITRHELVATLQQFLSSLIPLNAHAVIMIDEAQHLSPGVLEEIRLLSNFETDQAKLLQIVLVGQPNLDDLLRQPEMRQLNQRIARRCELQPLSDTEVQDYIDRRLFVATRGAPAVEERGAGPMDQSEPQAPLVQFTPRAIRTVAAFSKGIPRIVNTVCDRSLEVAFEHDTHSIDPGIVREAARRLKLPVPRFVPRTAVTRSAAAAASFALVAVLGMSWWSSRPAPRPTGESPRNEVATGPATNDARATAPTTNDARVNAPSNDRTATAGGSVPPPPAPEATAPAADKKPGSFEIAVAAFKTERRAAEVSAAIAVQGLPVSTRRIASGAWYQVVVGPFGTPEEADAARQTLVREGFGDARVSTVATEERR
jgi:type II secretory pathway predicted ATPase ExeA